MNCDRLCSACVKIIEPGERAAFRRGAWLHLSRYEARAAQKTPASADAPRDNRSSPK